MTQPDPAVVPPPSSLSISESVGLLKRAIEQADTPEGEHPYLFDTLSLVDAKRILSAWADAGLVDGPRGYAMAEGPPACSQCGGPHAFDTSIPSPTWNAVIHARNLPDYLCLPCIVQAFVAAGESFTATLWSDTLNGTPIEVIIGGQRAIDAERLSAENNQLRVQVRELGAGVRAGAPAWQPIETCPRDTPVLLWEADAQCATVGVMDYRYTQRCHALVHGEEALWCDSNGQREQPIFDATHWMALPPGPR